MPAEERPLREHKHTVRLKNLGVRVSIPGAIDALLPDVESVRDVLPTLLPEMDSLQAKLIVPGNRTEAFRKVLTAQSWWGDLPSRPMLEELCDGLLPALLAGKDFGEQ